MEQINQSLLVVNPRAALLSNLEVLTLLREIEADHLARSKAALRVKEEERSTPSSSVLPPHVSQGLEASENLRTIEVEAIQYLTADYLPTSSQTPQSIQKLVKSLAPYELTKGEKLQIVNLAPTLPVELYVIVEEFEDRLGERMNEILVHVADSVEPTAAPRSINNTIPSTASIVDGTSMDEWDYNLDLDGNNHEGEVDIVFDDTGEGAGIEGDLDIDDD